MTSWAGVACSLFVLLAALPLPTAAQSPPRAGDFDAHDRLFTQRGTIDSERLDTGVPLGGLGTGSFVLRTDGSIGNVSIGPTYPPLANLAGSLLELEVSAGGTTTRRALVLGGVDGTAGIARLRYRGIFPRAFLEATDPALPISAVVEAWSPFIPHDVQASSLPVVGFEILLHNAGSVPATASLTLHWPRDPALSVATSLHAAADPGGAVEESDGRAAVVFTLAPGADGRGFLCVAWPVEDHPCSSRFAQAADAGRYFLEHRTELRQKLRSWQALLFESSLPRWYAERLLNDLSPLVTSTRLHADGAFALAESATGLGGPLGTLDQSLLAHVATQAFFPELDRAQLESFAARQRPDGEIPHHIGYLDESGGAELGLDNSFLGWPDLACSFVLQVHHHWLWTGDEAFLDRMLPHVRSALQWLASRDLDDDGIAEGGSTFDYLGRPGAFAYTASLSLAAQRAGGELALARDDGEFAATCDAAFARTRSAMMHTLWNGRYFASSVDGAGNRGSSSCFLGQLAGEWYARLAGLGPLLPEDMVRRALDSMLTLNGAASPWIPPLDVNADGSALPAPFGWLPHATVFLAALALYEDRADAAWTCLRGIDRMLVEQDRDSWNVALYYDCATGHKLKPGYTWYMSTPASWFTLCATAGFGLDVPRGALTLSPHLASGQRELDVPLFAPTFTARLALHDADFGVRRELTFDVLATHSASPFVLRSLRTTPPVIAEGDVLSVALLHDGVVVSGRSGREGDELVFEPDVPITLEPGSRLAWSMEEPASRTAADALDAKGRAATQVLRNGLVEVELVHGERGLTRVTLTDLRRGGTVDLVAEDLFRLRLQPAGGRPALDVTTDPARTRVVTVSAVRSRVEQAADGTQTCLLEHDLHMRLAAEGDLHDLLVTVEVRLEPDRPVTHWTLRARGELLAGARGTLSFPQFLVRDPGTVGEPLRLSATNAFDPGLVPGAGDTAVPGGAADAPAVEAARGAGVTVSDDAVEHADWSSGWSRAGRAPSLTVGGPGWSLGVRCSDATGTRRSLSALGDHQQHLRITPATAFDATSTGAEGSLTLSAVEILFE